MEFKKRDIKKIKHATKEQLSKLHEEYKATTKNLNGMSPAGLFGIAVVGIVIMFLWPNRFFLLIGLILLLYPIYIFIRRGAHREGYFEGYYEMMTKFADRDQGPSEDTHEHTREHSHTEKPGQE